MVGNPVSAVRQRLADRKACNEAAVAYWAARDAANIAQNRLEKESDPHRRALLLADLAEAEIGQARLHFATFGPDPLDDEDGRDLADSLAYSAHLYRLLRQVEAAVASGRPRLQDGTNLDHAASDVLDRMAATPDLQARMRLLEELCDVVLPIVGGQAAEVLPCLPAPDMVGWLSEHQYSAGIAAARWS
jgi:hypothetical protein